MFKTPKQLQQLSDLVVKGKVSRRDFMTRATALGFSVLAAEHILTTAALAQTPNIGGLLRAGAPAASTDDSLDPATLDDSFDILSCFGLLRNNLVDIDEYSAPVPGLAESWDASSDVATWTFKLRRGVEFHNGKTMTSADVIDSINYHRGDESTSSAKNLIEQIEEIRADGNETVVFKLKDGNADFPVVLASYQLLIFPEGTRGAEFEKGIGTGPYELKYWEPGVRMEGTRNPNYYREGKPHFDEVHVIGINDVVSRTAALQTGQIDIMSRCDVKTVHLLDRNPDVQVFQVTGTKHYTAPMHVDKAPFDDVNVRQAIKYGIDRQAILDRILLGYGELGNDQPIAPTMRFHNPDIEQTQYDPDQARFYLKQAGLSSLDVDLAAADTAFAGAVDTAVLFQEQASQAGININVDRVSEDGYWNDIWLVRPCCMCFWAGRPTEDLMFSSAYQAGADWNDTRWANPRFNDLLVAARKELDENKRRDMYYEMQQLCHDDGGALIFSFAADVQAASADLQKPDHVASNWEFDGHKVAERWFWKS